MNSKDFLKTLHAELGSGVLDLRGILEGKKPAQFFTSDFDEAAQWVSSHKEKCNVYVGVCPRDSRKGGDTTNISRSYWLWADADAEKLKADGAVLLEKLMRRLPLPPTLVINSGSGGLHLYWKIEATTKLVDVERANRLIAGLLKTDAVGDVARILRVPDTYNHKHTPPAEVTFHSYHPSRVYTLEDIIAYAQVTDKYKKLIHTGDSSKYASRSERDFAVVKALARAGCKLDFVKTLFANTAIGDKADSEPEHYIDFTLEKVFAEESAIEQNKWGIISKDDAYWRVTQDGGLLQLSTFTFEPYVLLQAGSEEDVDTLLGTVRSRGQAWSDVPFTRRAFNKVDNLARELPKVEWQWLGKDSDVKKLLPYLLDNMTQQYSYVPVKQATSVLGRHGNLLILPKQVIGQQGEINADKAEIKWLNTGREYPKVSFKDTNNTFAEQELGKFLNVFFSLNKLENCVAMLGWLVASLYKPVLADRNIHFPVLNLFGTRGSGKTTVLTNVLQPLVGYEKARAYDANTTNFVMLSLLGSSNNLFVSLSEYRRSSLRDPERIIRYILLAYDGSSDSRGRSNQTTQNYELSTPFTIDGEDPIVDPACLERIIQINMRPETIADGTAAFEAFEQLQNVDLNAVAYALHLWSLNNDIDYTAGLAEVKTILQHAVPDRVRKNFAVVVSGLRAFQNFCRAYGYEMEHVGGVALNAAELLLPIMENVVNIETGQTSLLVDVFVEDVINHIAINDGPDSFIFRYDADKAHLYIHLSGAYNWWASKRASARLPILEEKAIKNQMVDRMAPIDLPAGPGCYVLGRQGTHMGRYGTMRAYCISLTQAVESGLNIPSTLSRFESEVKVKKQLDK